MSEILAGHCHRNESFVSPSEPEAEEYLGGVRPMSDTCLPRAAEPIRDAWAYLSVRH